MVSRVPVGNLLCVANFHTNAGYAWTFIERLYAGLADELAPHGVRTWVAYPEVRDTPVPLEGSAAEPLELAVSLVSVRGVIRLAAEVRKRRIRTLYLTDRAVWHPAYAVLRLLGIRSIIVHDHTSGDRTAPRGWRRALKALSRRFRPALADRVLAVSEYVARRQVEVALVPPSRVQVTLNSVEIPTDLDARELRYTFGIPAGRPIVACACRAAEYKGVQHLLRAFDLLDHDGPRPPVLIYFGDGPFMDELRAVRESLRHRESVILAGFQADAADLLAGADLCVVPSVWGEAFGLAAVEPAARGLPVVATAVGGIPEVVVDGKTGLLAPPAEPAALAGRVQILLDDEGLRTRMGTAGREWVVARFTRERQTRELSTLFREMMGLPAAPAARPVAPLVV